MDEEISFRTISICQIYQEITNLLIKCLFVAEIVQLLNEYQSEVIECQRPNNFKDMFSVLRGNKIERIQHESTKHFVTSYSLKMVLIYQR